jgi:hypothetical protein
MIISFCFCKGMIFSYFHGSPRYLNSSSLHDECNSWRHLLTLTNNIHFTQSTRKIFHIFTSATARIIHRAGYFKFRKPTKPIILTIRQSFLTILIYHWGNIASALFILPSVILVLLLLYCCTGYKLWFFYPSSINLV